MEDAPDPDINSAVALTNAPPPAPSPPSALPVNVFDFLVTDETPNTSRVSLGGSKEQMQMVEHAPHIFETSRRSSYASYDEREMDYDDSYNAKGYSYGEEPVTVVHPTAYETPAPKPCQNGHHRDSYNEVEIEPRSQKSTDKKRKRQVEDLDLTQARRPSQELDEVMLDADATGPPILHSGLTGGLNRLLSKSKFLPSPDYSGGDGTEPSAVSPVKRPKQQITIEKRGRTSSALVRVRKIRRPSDESRPRKHHRSHKHDRHSDETHHTHAHVRTHSERPKRALKTIEYPGHGSLSTSQEDERQQQLVLYRTRAELFMSFVTKGPESDKGCSVHKALKRYHRERGTMGLGLGKAEEEKELWREVRLRRNERGEVVVMF